MNLVRKVLLVHPDARTRRRCVMLLAACGFDLRVAASAVAAEDAVRSEWFDLAVLEHNLPDAPDFELADRLRRVQPTLAIMLLVEQLEFPLVVKSIHQGVRDVITPTEDLAPIVARVCAYFEVVPSLDPYLSSAELKQAEAVLDCLGGVGGTDIPASFAQNAAPSQLMDAAREKSLLESQLLRIAHERNMLEVQLKTMLAQSAELARGRADASAIRSQRELIAASRTAIEDNARALSNQRAEIARERESLDSDHRLLAGSNTPQMSPELSRLEELRIQLAAQAERQGAETEQLARERAQFSVERQSWHADLETLRDEEENLRRYESRLRELQANLETERLALAAANQSAARSPSNSQDGPEAGARESWTKFQRATELFEAEKAHLREDRLALRDWESALKQREESLATREARLAAQPPQKAAHAVTPAQPPAQSTLRSLTRAPFEAAMAVLKPRK